MIASEAMPSNERPTLTPEERAEIIGRVTRLADLLDNSIRIPVINYRIGLDPLIGLIPGAGDAVSLGFSGYILFEAWRMGIPGHTLLRMIVNVLFDFAGGSIPLVGDVFDAVFKANRRNVKLLTDFEETSRQQNADDKL